jgi:hypothetical protein
MRDLRADKGMGWMPVNGMWLTHLAINSAARDLTYDLAVDVSGWGRPSPEAAGLVPVRRLPVDELPGGTPVGLPLLIGGVLLAGAFATRPDQRRPN